MIDTKCQCTLFIAESEIARKKQHSEKDHCIEHSQFWHF